MLSDLMRCPMDSIATSEVLGLSLSQYSALVQENLIEVCEIDRGTTLAPFIRFHNFWNMFEYKLRMSLRNRDGYIYLNVATILDDLAEELEMRERAGDLALDALFEIVNNFFLSEARQNGSFKRIEFDSMEDVRSTCLGLSADFSCLVERVDQLAKLLDPLPY